MNVQQAAEALSVSPRRVRAMIADGVLPAHRNGRAWVVDEIPSPAARRNGRPLSERSWAHLATALKTRVVTDVAGHERERTAARMRQLRDAENPAALLAGWRPPEAPPDIYMDSLVAHAEDAEGSNAKRVLARRHREYLRESQDLANVVITERLISGLDRHRLAEMAGVAEHIVRDMETQRALTSPSEVRRVLRALNIDATALPSMVLA